MALEIQNYSHDEVAKHAAALIREEVSMRADCDLCAAVVRSVARPAPAVDLEAVVARLDRVRSQLIGNGYTQELGIELSALRDDLLALRGGR